MTTQPENLCNARCGHTNCPNCGCHNVPVSEVLAEIRKEVEKLPTMYPNDEVILKADVLALLVARDEQEKG